jgi:hypothetical protein
MGSEIERKVPVEGVDRNYSVNEYKPGVDLNKTQHCWSVHPSNSIQLIP